MTGINNPGYNSKKKKSPGAKVRDVVCTVESAANTGTITRPFGVALRLNSCARAAIFLFCSGSPAGPTRDRSLS